MSTAKEEELREALLAVKDWAGQRMPSGLRAQMLDALSDKPPSNLSVRAQRRVDTPMHRTDFDVRPPR